MAVIPPQFREMTVDDLYRLCRNMRANRCGSYKILIERDLGFTPVNDILIHSQDQYVTFMDKYEAQAWQERERLRYEQGKEGKAEAAPAETEGPGTAGA